MYFLPLWVPVTCFPLSNLFALFLFFRAYVLSHHLNPFLWTSIFWSSLNNQRYYLIMESSFSINFLLCIGRETFSVTLIHSALNISSLFQKFVFIYFSFQSIFNNLISLPYYPATCQSMSKIYMTWICYFSLNLIFVLCRNMHILK